MTSHIKYGGVPSGFDALTIAQLATDLHKKGEGSPELVVVCRDDKQLAALADQIAFFKPLIERLEFPAWDCQPYDRASPHASITAKRMMTLSRLVRTTARATPCVLLTTVNALLQRVPSRAYMAKKALSAAPGNSVKLASLAKWLETNGYMRSSTVRETGEYAMRGGLLDLFPPGLENPVRLDFFGDQIESIRSFDAETQRSANHLKRLDLVPTSEAQINNDSMAKFRMAYLALFGGATKGDMLYEAISEGRRYSGYEHWLPLFHEKLETLTDYLPNSSYIYMPSAEEAIKERFKTIADYYSSRFAANAKDWKVAQYKPLQPDNLYVGDEELALIYETTKRITLSSFALPDSDLGGRRVPSFAAEREANTVWEAVKTLLKATKKRVIITASSLSSKERLHSLLVDHGIMGVKPVDNWAQAESLKKGEIALTQLPLEEGFETPDMLILSDSDILGERQGRKTKKKRAQDHILEATSLAANDVVVHIEHGIGRFIGLRTLAVSGAPVDCLEIHYASDAKLFLPVQNIELLSRYGSEDTEVQLDRLGGVAWQQRKAKLKQRIKEMAAALMKVAAARFARPAPVLLPAEGAFDEFVAKFPYEETEDQQNAIDAVIDDLGAGKPMDRLVCGDVGFGKTEVALRAAFVAAMAGKQVAVVVPTTLLARQHYRNFQERFHNTPLRLGMLSRLVSSKEATETKLGLVNGQVDIVIGTHALLSKSIAFKDLGMVIIDEEQHFGVAHKERLKELRNDVHVLTLTATPIPRTLQLAMTGVRDLSIIATPPVDRLAVRSFVTPFDPMIVREALLREKYRNGQAFYVCPRIDDLPEAEAYLREFVPEVKFIVAHGQMPPSDLEDRIGMFYDGKVDVLLSTTIVESGIDIPRANTLIIHRADRFGLAQLYQLRGRVGRSKARAYALFTVPAERQITPQAEKRLKVLQSLDTLGAGFQLASHDLDIRGAGNLLGDEQSGHIKEVGYELYQHMLEEAIAMLKAGITDVVSDEWSPQITLGVAMMIPETYVSDLTLRLQLYRELGDLRDDEAVDGFAASMIDRFGKLPVEVTALLKTAVIKNLCRAANIEKVDAGPKGAVITFRENKFANPEGLMKMLRSEGAGAKVRPDEKIVFLRDWAKAADRLQGCAKLLSEIARLTR
jgi:transcription-repair coupling factor (superfamily II helicase)